VSCPGPPRLGKRYLKKRSRENTFLKKGSASKMGAIPLKRKKAGKEKILFIRKGGEE